MMAQCILHYIKDKNYSMWGEKQDGIYQIWRISLWFLYCLTLQKTKFWISVNVQYSVTRFSHPSIPLILWEKKTICKFAKILAIFFYLIQDNYYKKYVSALFNVIILQKNNAVSTPRCPEPDRDNKSLKNVGYRCNFSYIFKHFSNEEWDIIIK